MPIKPGPVSIQIGSYTVKADSISKTYETLPFDRVEFDHEKLKSVPLSTGTVPQIVTLLGGVPAEVVIDCALTGMVGGASSYVPRPLIPNVYTTDTDKVKQRVNITRYKLTASSPESASDPTQVDGIFGYLVSHRNLLSAFQNRLAIFGTSVGYEFLLQAQSDNIQALYFTTGLTFTAPGISQSQVMVVDATVGSEFLIANSSGGWDIWKGYDLTLETRTVTAASAP